MPDNFAVLLIDMQKEFVKKLKKGEADKIIPCQLRMINKLCLKRKTPLVVLEYSGYSKTIRVLHRALLRAPKLKTITKSFDDGFLHTGLREHLKALRVDTLVLMGINATCCVRATAESAIRSKFKIITAEQLIAGRPNHDAEKNAGWYTQNGLFYNDFDILIEDMEQGSRLYLDNKFKARKRRWWFW